MHFSDFEPNLAEKDVPDYKVVPKIFQMLLGGSGLKIWRKVNVETSSLPSCKPLPGLDKVVTGEQREPRCARRKVISGRKKGAKSRRDTWVSPTDAVGTSECWLEVVVFSSNGLSCSAAAGTAADLRLWGGGPAPIWGSEGGAGSGPTERQGETQAGRSQVTLGADRPKHSDISTADKEGA